MTAVLPRLKSARFGRPGSERGLTLLELMIALFMVAALTTTLWLVYNANFFAFYNQSKRTDIKGETGRALASMSWELRQAASLTTATATNLIFTFDTDGNGTDDSVQVTWAGASGNPLNRVSGGLTTALINSVSSLAFSYYDSSKALLSFPVTLSQVKSVAINLTSVGGDESFTLRSQVSLRDL
jgi:type II secretory pathway component PulJ